MLDMGSYPVKLALVYGSEKRNVPPNMNMLLYKFMTFSLHAHMLQSSFMPLKGNTISKLREMDL